MALGLVSLFLVIFGNAGIYYRGDDHKKIGFEECATRITRIAKQCSLDADW